MARKQYPSDHRRWFRVMEDILDDDGYRSMRAHDKVAWIGKQLDGCTSELWREPGRILVEVVCEATYRSLGVERLVEEVQLVARIRPHSRPRANR